MTRARANKACPGDFRTGGLSAAILRGDPRAAARMLTLIDDRDPAARRILKRLYRSTGRARLIGVTGAAGSGKSTLIGRMAEELRRRKKSVGILAVDPSSPLTGGALLGDRIRMRAHFLDDGVFIRSLATRGGLGGASGALVEAAQVLDALGKEYILIETIGIGQDQIDVAGIAQMVLTVVSAGSGDDVQALKAGLFEVTDLLVINRADLPGTDELQAKFAGAPAFERVPIARVSALTGDGMAALIDRIDSQWRHSAAAENRARRSVEIARRQLGSLLYDALMDGVRKTIGEDRIEGWVRRIAERREDPYSAARAILAQLGFDGKKSNEPRRAQK